jgi:peptidoglycan-associated lipoprotein
MALEGCRHRLTGLPPPPPSAGPAVLAPASTTAAQSALLPEDDYDRMRRTDLDAINRMGLLMDAHFDPNSARIRDIDRAVLARNAEILRKFDFMIVTVQGHCDDRGTAEYNLALAERRARAVRDYLIALRVPGPRLKMASRSKDAPVCTQQSEQCWTRNRRVHLTVSGKTPVGH